MMKNTRGVEIGEGTEKGQVPGRPAEAMAGLDVKESERRT